VEKKKNALYTHLSLFNSPSLLSLLFCSLAGPNFFFKKKNQGSGPRACNVRPRLGLDFCLCWGIFFCGFTRMKWKMTISLIPNTYRERDEDKKVLIKRKEE
jgi:hypothetical protein